MALKLDPARPAGRCAEAGTDRPRAGLRCAAQRLRRGAVRPLCRELRQVARRQARLSRARVSGSRRSAGQGRTRFAHCGRSRLRHRADGREAAADRDRCSKATTFRRRCSRRPRPRASTTGCAKADLQIVRCRPAKADLVTAADVFMYVGALEGIVNTVAGCWPARPVRFLRRETWRAETSFVLQPSRRYAHSETYVRRVLAANGFSILSLATKAIRQDRREPVEGLVVVAGKAHAA